MAPITVVVVGRNSDKEIENGKELYKGELIKIIQGGKAGTVKSTKALTHRDIKEFFARFAEAILVDQERVSTLPHKEFHSFYNDGVAQE
jgi:hypothetical protein